MNQGAEQGVSAKVQEAGCVARYSLQRCRKQGAVHGLGVQEAGWGIYSTLNRKNAALFSGANSRQMLPSTTATESGFRVRGARCRARVNVWI